MVFMRKFWILILFFRGVRALIGSFGRDVHAFYYLWYGNISSDGRWKHWDHEVLPHWQESVNKNYPQVGQRHQPPESIHSPFYPLRGLYSSSDISTMTSHFHEMKSVGIKVVVVSWWGQKSRLESTDTQGVSTDALVPTILLAASLVDGISIAFHLEPYPGRTAQSTVDDIRYIYDMYGSSNVLYKIGNKLVFYVYDSYHIAPSDWAQYFSSGGMSTIRDTKYDSFVIGLWLDYHHGEHLVTGGFDGVYSYFASDGFSYGSSTGNWKTMCQYAKKNGLLCNLSVGPGYKDDKIRPWNSHNTKQRENGRYYSSMWNRAIIANPDIISITSYNEWGEGTQIEPARKLVDIPGWTSENNDYVDYEQLEPHGYLLLTATKVTEFLSETKIDMDVFHEL